ncbi:DUF6677 family protein [Chengkuizengella axinellae]|uniref:TM2 domain-containing protein n=1 Tax=Chengkuizengella axinellae TaxID=3064388 RepID=A0ABT9J5T3_9BACL|nr:DUF6677 family protein [Chengkuizengella sp. 2205SS18-9]MDP5276985.1 hypothetical protein [Chengkuizengella sp. 2205SS18-9]
MENRELPNNSVESEQERMDDFIEQRIHHHKQQMNSSSVPVQAANNKNKFVTGLLAFLLPGMGHFYLGLMQRGLMFMLLLAIDIVFIVSLGINIEDSSIPLIVLFSLIIPAIYFYNIFDALQSADKINAYGSSEDAKMNIKDGKTFGIVLIAAGALLFIISNKPAWISLVFDLFGSYLGGVALILAGGLLLLSEFKKKNK